MSIYPVIYIFGTILVPFLSDRIQKRFTLICSAFLLGLFLILVGPSKILGIEENLTTMIVGLVLSGCLLGPIAIPALPEMLESIEGKFQ